MALALRCLSSRLARLALNRSSLDRLAAPCALAAQTQVRSYLNKNSPKIEDLDPSQLPDFEVSSDSKEWSYVERILPKTTVPLPKKTEGPFASGWIPPREEGKTHPYFVPRTRNHMQPVYLKVTARGSRKITIVRRIQGDIWKMEQELRQYLEDKSTKVYKHIASRVNEMSGQIRFRGDHLAYVKQWMESKGF